MHRWELVVSLQICRVLWSHSLQKMVTVNLSGNGPGVIVSLPNLVLFHTLPRLYFLWRMTLLQAPCHFLVSFPLQFISSSKEGLNQPWRSSLWSTSLRLSFSNKYLQRERHSLDWDEQRPLILYLRKISHPLLLSMIWVFGKVAYIHLYEDSLFIIFSCDMRWESDRGKLWKVFGERSAIYSFLVSLLIIRRFSLQWHLKAQATVHIRTMHIEIVLAKTIRG